MDLPDPSMERGPKRDRLDRRSSAHGVSHQQMAHLVASTFPMRRFEGMLSESWVSRAWESP